MLRDGHDQGTAIFDDEPYVRGAEFGYPDGAVVSEFVSAKRDELRSNRVKSTFNASIVIFAASIELPRPYDASRTLRLYLTIMSSIEVNLATLFDYEEIYTSMTLQAREELYRVEHDATLVATEAANLADGKLIMIMVLESSLTKRL